MWQCHLKDEAGAQQTREVCCAGLLSICCAGDVGALRGRSIHLLRGKRLLPQDVLWRWRCLHSSGRAGKSFWGRSRSGPSAPFSATVDGANAKTKQTTINENKFIHWLAGKRRQPWLPGYRCLRPRPPDLAIDGACAGNLKADLGRCKSIDVLNVFP